MGAIHSSAGALLLHFGCSAERTTAHLSSEKELEMLLLLSFYDT